MEFSKYKNIQIQKIKSQLSEWRTREEPINHSEVYRFLHSIQGSAGTLQLGGLHQLSGHLLSKLKLMEDRQWEKEELRTFLDELINLTDEYETFSSTEYGNNKDHRFEENVPLIQIIDDDISMIILLKDVLEESGWMVAASTDPKKAISQYYDLNPDCVIIDIHLPGINGIQLLENIQQHTHQHFVPKIMMSLMNDRETRMKAYKLGADDFIEKPIDLEELTVRIAHHLKKKELVDKLVLIDELTQVYNRRFLPHVYNRNLRDMKRNKQPFSIAILDLDHFKQINDSLGHINGDKILSAFAAFLKSHTRSTDIIFRFGGEEFVIILENTHQLEAAESVSRWLTKFSKPPLQIDNETLFITFSAGIYTIHHQEITLETALMAADQALFTAKANGRARVEIANDTIVDLPKRKLFVSIIDDDPIIRTMLMRILNVMDFSNFDLNLAEFGDGVQFFKSNRLEEKGEHFLIIDGVMPVMDGIEILQQVQKIKHSHNIHVLMLTGRKSEADIEKALALGADDYVTKPFSIKELQARIQRLIKRMK
ncbi:response regulator [Neobacillus cucumis]|uniref:response regulator n=1 Tax=Neobacillus cucumis TaxID=1740721 RepID=UPI002E21EC4E|nr:response regulator [Neobacillus cucumis]MED4227570.1 response regulator [Neobacillus cucumis]